MILSNSKVPSDIAIETLAQFDIPQKKYALQRVTHGLINKSYVVTDMSLGKKVFFLQQIDHHVFADIEGIMDNISVVLRHFSSLHDAPKHLITRQTNSGSNYYKSKAGEYWRLYDFVEGNTYQRAENNHLAGEAGKMFGSFLNALAGVEVASIRITIPKFHDIEFRYEQFKESLINARPDRKAKAADLIVAADANISYVSDVYGEIISRCPARVTHNDTKLSNLLFDDLQKGICVVDYDTLMPGYWPLDFGDAVRTICATTVEDDTDLGNTEIDLDIFSAFTKNFFEKLMGSITTEEIRLLVRAVPYMPFLMGLRMLTDYLNNDIYYNTQYDEHNYDRASNQFALFKNGLSQQEKMNNIVAKLVSA